jgi:hypothetical protein
MVCELYHNKTITKKEYITRSLDILIFQEKQCLRIRLETYNRNCMITVTSEKSSFVLMEKSGGRSFGAS